MKTLKNHTIYYDSECPMCSRYTNLFVSSKMLDHDGRVPYEHAVGVRNTVDWNRARNEIALEDRSTGEVKYGVESLTMILSHSFPSLIRVFKHKRVTNLLRALYFFISCNRKVIAPGKFFEEKNSCAPDMHAGFRWAYIFITWLITSIVLICYSSFTVPLVSESSMFREFIICGGQILFQGTIIAFINPKRSIHYLGNMMTISIMGALLLFPAFVIQIWIDSAIFFVGYFMLVVAIMLFEHRRRVGILELPWYLSASWILYRFLWLPFIL